MDFLTVVIVIVIVGVVAGIVNIAYISGQKNAFLKLLDSLNDFDATDVILGEDGLTGFSYDTERKKVCLLAISGNQPTAWVYKFNDVLSCELYEDGEVLTKTSRMSQAGGALIGGLVLGGLGAIIGGLSGKTKTTNLINRIDLRLIINDSKSPIHDINIMKHETTKTGILYKSAIEKARHWHGIMSVIIKRADIQDEKVIEIDSAKENDTTKNAALLSINEAPNLIDELTKLGDLLDRGILTNDEFKTQKERLLGS